MWRAQGVNTSTGVQIISNDCRYDEFAPGAENRATVVISNSGLNTHKIVRLSLVTPDDQPNTAKLVTAALAEGMPHSPSRPIRQFLSDIRGGAATPPPST